MKKVARFLCTKIREMAGGKKIRELAHSGDSVVLHSSRREVLHLLSILYVHLRFYIYDGEAVSPSLQTYGGLCLGKGERGCEADRRVARPGEAERAGVG